MPDPRLTAAPNVNQELLNRAIRHATLLERYKARQVDEILTFLDRDVFPDLLKRLENRLKRVRLRGADSGVFVTRRYRAMVASMNKMIQAGLRHANGTLSADLKKLALSEAEWQAATLRRAVPLEIDFTVPSPRLLRSIVTSQPFQGGHLRDWFRGLTRSTQDAVVRGVNIGLAQGETLDQIVRRVRGTRALNFTDGVLRMPRHQVKTLVHTAAAHVSNAARMATYEENSDVIKAVIWVATLDASTCPTCGAADGRSTAELGMTPPDPHPFCRCTTVPQTKSWKELGIDARDVPPSTRASMNGQISEKISFRTWFGQQTAAQQDMAFGRGKALLMRRGQVSIDRLSDSHFRPLTLRQVIKREGIDIGEDATMRRLLHLE